MLSPKNKTTRGAGAAMDNPLDIKSESARKIIFKFRVSCVRVIKILKLPQCWPSTLPVCDISRPALLSSIIAYDQYNSKRRAFDQGFRSEERRVGKEWRCRWWPER